MPKRRPPREVWHALRLRVLERDGYQCVRCRAPLTIETGNVDHIVSGKRGTNELANLRSLCIVCHVTRKDFRHRGMIGEAIRKGIIPPDYRDLLWDD